MRLILLDTKTGFILRANDKGECAYMGPVFSGNAEDRLLSRTMLL
jgi:hypothetical protein